MYIGSQKIAKTIFKKNKVKGIILLDYKNPHKVKISKTIEYWQKYRNTDY